MKKCRHYLIIFAIIIYCIVPLCLFLCKNTVVYSSPEEFCQTEGYENYQIVYGESSIFVLYDKSPSEVGFQILKDTENGLVPIHYRTVLRDTVHSPFAVIVKGKGVDDNYIFFPNASRIGKAIHDARGSTFYFLSWSSEEMIEFGNSYAIAYIGTESKEYYKNDYWFVVETDYNTD